MRKIDLHLHSYYSDGTHSPSEIVKKAKELNIECMSLTDHDTVAGIDECIDACAKENITFIPGFELSTTYNKESVHILGYFNKETYNNPNLIKFLKDLKNKRIDRCYKMAEKLKEHFNIEIDINKLIGDGNKVVARPHIAKAIIEAGYNYDFNYIFDNLIGNNCPAYVPANKISTEEGIKILKGFNAKVFLAHPVLLKKTKLEELIPLGFDGIEGYYSLNSPKDTNFFVDFARKNNLLVSCGSDDHGIIADKKHGSIGCVEIDDINYEMLINFLAN